MATFKQYDVVRVIRLLHPVEEYDGWRFNQRSPHIGDTGTLVEILHASDLPDKYVVECSRQDGVTIWLSDFDAEEIEPLS